MIVRDAKEGDLPWLLEQVKGLDKFMTTRHSLLTKNVKLQEDLLLGLIRHHLFFIAENDSGQQVGFITGIVSHHVLNPGLKVLYETLWWVPLEHRGTRTGSLLFKAFADWGRENVDWVWFSLQMNTPVDDRILLREGFKEQERQFLLEV